MDKENFLDLKSDGNYRRVWRTSVEDNWFFKYLGFFIWNNDHLIGLV